MIYSLWHQNYRHVICIHNIASVFLGGKEYFPDEAFILYTDNHGRFGFLPICRHM